MNALDAAVAMLLLVALAFASSTLLAALIDAHRRGLARVHKSGRSWERDEPGHFCVLDHGYGWTCGHPSHRDDVA